MRALFVVALMFLAGCSTSPTSPEDAIAAPSERILKYGTRPAGDYATVVIRRDHGLIGSGCHMTAFIDDERVAALDPREQATLYVPPGDYVLGAGIEGRGLCGAAADGRARDVTLKAGQVKAYRLFTDQDGNVDVVAAPR